MLPSDMMSIEESRTHIEAWVMNREMREWEINNQGLLWIVKLTETFEINTYLNADWTINVYEFYDSDLQTAMNEAATWALVAVGIDRMKERDEARTRDSE